MSDWSVEQLRLTVFPVRDLREPDPNWWSKVIGTNPEIKTVQKGFGIKEAGPIKNGYCNLILEIQASRVDWLFAATVKGGEPLKGFPVFDSTKGALDTFRAFLEPWIKAVPPIKRLALGSVLVMPVEGRQAGYEYISKYLPAIRLDPKDSTDFSYSINRPRLSRSVENLKINRLSRWAVAQLKAVQIQGEIPGGLAIVEGSGEFHAVRAELDVNTAAERSEALPEDRQGAVFGELVSLAEEIAVKGDIP